MCCVGESGSGSVLGTFSGSRTPQLLYTRSELRIYKSAPSVLKLAANLKPPLVSMMSSADCSFFKHPSNLDSNTIESCGGLQFPSHKLFFFGLDYSIVKN